jgi:predicted anti-sigma-YlaC factor YlaD
MGCEECREAISAQLDGEELLGEEVAVAAHLDGCADCRAFAERAARVTRLARTRPAEPGPDLVAAVLAAAPRRPARSRVGALRVALGAVGLGQFALAVSGVVAAGSSGHDAAELSGATAAHLVNEASAWNLALAVGFLWVATGTSRATGLVPVIGAFVGVLTVLSGVDAVAGRVDVERLATHGLVVLGLVLLLALRRATRDGGGARAGRPPTRPAIGHAAPGWHLRRTTGEGPSDGLAPSARRRAA